jgi:D-alanine-D-alanine ligase
MSNSAIVIITGGDTPERSGSIESASYLFDVIKELYPVVLVELSYGNWSVLDENITDIPSDELEFDGALIFRAKISGVIIHPVAAIISIHGYPGETGELQGYLDIQGIHYSGSGVFASSLASKKFECKAFLQSLLGISIARQWEFKQSSISLSSWESSGLPMPFVIKPNQLGSGVGVISVHHSSGIELALNEANTFSDSLFIEEYLDGIELTVGAIRLADLELAFEIAEVVRPASSDAIRRYSARKMAQIVIPANISPSIAAELHSRILEIGKALDLRGFYRADFILVGKQLYFLEVNTLPGTAQQSVLMKQAEASGLSAKSLFMMLVEDLLQHTNSDFFDRGKLNFCNFNLTS